MRTHRLFSTEISSEGMSKHRELCCLDAMVSCQFEILSERVMCFALPEWLEARPRRMLAWIQRYVPWYAAPWEVNAIRKGKGDHVSGVRLNCACSNCSFLILKKHKKCTLQH